LDQSGKIRGVEGVIDKDRASARLAQQLDADLLMILTDVPSVALNYGTPDQRWIRRVTPQALKGHHFEAGSMGPKVEACIDFVEITRSRAAIGSLDDALSILEGEAGTQIMAGTFETEFYEQ
jgi:carbamate kinase